MATLNAGMTRDDAFALLKAHNTDPFHIEHGETVEQTMRYFAREFDPDNVEFWGIVGLLHDLDWEEHDDEPELHTIYAAPLIEGAAVVMRPSKSVMDFNVKSLKKKFKDKRFAAGVDREVIRSGAEMLGWELDELFDRTIQAMRSFAPDRDTFVPAEG